MKYWKEKAKSHRDVDAELAEQKKLTKRAQDELAKVTKTMQVGHSCDDDDGDDDHELE